MIYSYILCNIVIIDTKQKNKDIKQMNNKSIVFKKSGYNQVNLLMIDSLLLKHGISLKNHTYNVIDLGTSYKIVIRKIEIV